MMLQAEKLRAMATKTLRYSQSKMAKRLAQEVLGFLEMRVVKRITETE